jgi:hypothetical protein
MDSIEIQGEMLSVRSPTWEPLLELAGEDIDDFMWMFDLELEDETRLHAYKHHWTRRYLHLSDDGRAFAYRGSADLDDEGSYRQVCPHCQLREALRGRLLERRWDDELEI